MSLEEFFSIYKKEIDLIRAQNRVECELYSIIAYIIRTGKRGLDISLRDVSTRRTTKFSERFKGKAGFPDFIILERKESNDAKILGAIEAKYVDENFGNLSKKNIDQLQRHRDSYKRLIYTNGLEWRFYHEGKRIWKVVLGTADEEKIVWDDKEWECLLKKLDEIDWLNKRVS